MCPSMKVGFRSFRTVTFVADLVTAVSFDPNGDYLAAGDKGGRCVLFRKETSKVLSYSSVFLEPLQRKLEFSFIHEFVSHEPEFDYLKSLEIEEKINKIRFLRCCGDTIFLLVTNGTHSGRKNIMPTEKTMKLWKVHNRRVKTLVGANIGPSEVVPQFLASNCKSLGPL